MNTEQQLIDSLSEIDGINATNIFDVINHFVNNGILTEDEIKVHLKSTHSNISDWSF
tara:strand:+ start:400 stop:570 length:171 start_codon:yes stop_codon:yes gene_type:complete